MRKNEYVQAAYAALERSEDADSVLRKLRAYLEKRGLAKLYPQILRGVSERAKRKSRGSTPLVIVARTEDTRRFENEITSAVRTLTGAVEYHTHIDTSIIGGFIVRNRDTRIDKSYKSTLLHTYHKLTDQV